MKNSILEQLNLTPQERRMVVGIGAVVFVVLNLLLVVPHFKDLGQVREELANTRKKIASENEEIKKDTEGNDSYKKQLEQLQHQQGGGIVNQQVQLQLTVSDQARNAGVNVSEIRAVGSGDAPTNEFYEEQSVRINFESEEAQLVNFLVNVGNDPAMIRVRELSLRPADANRYRLKGDAVLSANYLKQVAKTAPAASQPAPAPARGRIAGPSPVVSGGTGKGPALSGRHGTNASPRR